MVKNMAKEGPSLFDYIQKINETARQEKTHAVLSAQEMLAQNFGDTMLENSEMVAFVEILNMVKPQILKMSQEISNVFDEIEMPIKDERFCESADKAYKAIDQIDDFLTAKESDTQIFFDSLYLLKRFWMKNFDDIQIDSDKKNKFLYLITKFLDHINLLIIKKQ